MNSLIPYTFAETEHQTSINPNATFFLDLFCAKNTNPVRAIRGFRVPWADLHFGTGAILDFCVQAPAQRRLDKPILFLLNFGRLTFLDTDFGHTFLRYWI